MFFVIDGVDGAGKGEQISRLKRDLPSLYPEKEFVFTREPGGTNVPLAEDIRSLILSDRAKVASGAVMVQLFGASRFEHLEKLILPALRTGRVVVSDRFDCSTWAFQIAGQGGGKRAVTLFNVQRALIEGMLGTWTTIILDVDVDTAMQRTGNRKGQAHTHFDTRRKEFHEAVRAAFQTYANEFRHTHIIDASRSIDEVYVDVLEIVRRGLA